MTRAYSRSNPAPSQANYLLRRCLAVQLARQFELRLRGRDNLSLLDVGCGDRPFEPLSRPWVTRYVGLEHEPGPHVDVVGSADALPFGDESFDVVCPARSSSMC